MVRPPLCLPLCLLLAPAYPDAPAVSGDYAGPQTGDVRIPLPDPDPVAFLQKCIAKYDREVKGYTLTLRKQERIGGTLHPVEVIEVHFKDKPHSVHFYWKQGERKAKSVLYVEEENDGQLLVLPAGPLAALVVLSKAVD